MAIVETESEGFLRVAAKLDGFKQLLQDMKQAAVDFSDSFAHERHNTEQLYAYLLEEYVELREMVSERARLAHLVRIQEMYAEVQDRVLQGKVSDGVLRLEETIRMWKEVKRAAGTGDPTIDQKLCMLQRSLVGKVCG